MILSNRFLPAPSGGLTALLCLLVAVPALHATDQFVTIHEAKLQSDVSGTGCGWSYFGCSAAVEGDTAIIGAYRAGERKILYTDQLHENRCGYAYIFAYDGSAWCQSQTLIPDDGVRDDCFGYSVSLSGDTAIVGAHGADPNGAESGQAYVYECANDTWALQKKLLPEDGSAGDHFGYSVSISGDIAAVGAYEKDANAKEASGCVYIFYRNQGGVDNWGQITNISPDDVVASNRFGRSVSIFSNTLVVGTQDDSVYIFYRDQGGADNWGQVTKLSGTSDSEFGWAVSISGDTVAVGAPSAVGGQSRTSGRVYLFSRNEGGADLWGQVADLIPDEGANNTHGDRFGGAVAIDGATLVVGADGGDTHNLGEAFVFDGSGESWTQQARILPTTDNDPLTGYYRQSYGRAVAVSGNTALIGEPEKWGLPVSPHMHLGYGCARFFTRTDATWSDQPRVDVGVNPNGAELKFGEDVAISGDTAIVLAPGEPGVYVYRWDGAAWQEEARLHDIIGYREFYGGVALDGDTAVVGGSILDGDYHGCVSVFTRSGTEWTLQATLRSPVGGQDGAFCIPAISGNTVVVGEPYYEYDDNRTGRVYVFVRTGTTWAWQETLVGAGVGPDHHFGFSVAISDDIVVVGAPAYGDEYPRRYGDVFVFQRSGGSWSEDDPLTGYSFFYNDLISGYNSGFGWHVAVSGDTLVIGAAGNDYPESDSLPNVRRGSGTAFVCERMSGGLWNLTAKLETTTYRFGSDVAIEGDRLAVGASQGNWMNGNNQGSVYVYERDSVGWGWSQVAKLVADPDASPGDNDSFGSAVDISGSRIFVSDPWWNLYGSTYEAQTAGLAYIIRLSTGIDWGDLPDTYELVTAANNGARHVIGNVRLGDLVDHDADGQPNEYAGTTSGGDDGDGTDDDDGISVVGSWTNGVDGGSVEIRVQGSNGYVSGWVDWDGNSQFDEGDQVLDMVPVSGGAQTVTFEIPESAVVDGDFSFFSRFRLAEDNTEPLTSTGQVLGGEVEDYLLKPASIGNSGFVTMEADTEADVPSLSLSFEVRAGATYTILSRDGFDTAPEVLETEESVSGGSFTFTDTDVLNVESRFYQVVEEKDGILTTNPVVNAVHVVPLINSKWYRLSLPVDFGAGQNDLSGSFGQQLKRGLYGGNDGDLLYILSGSVWSWYLLNDLRNWVLQGGAGINAMDGCQGFWVKRQNADAAHPNIIFSGRCRTSHAPVEIEGGKWHLIAWPYPAPRRERYGWGFADSGAYGGSSWLLGDNIVVDDQILWLDTEGRWRKMDGSSAEDEQLRSLDAYYYYHRGNGFTWLPKP